MGTSGYREVKNVELPVARRLYAADAEDMEAIEAYNNEPWVEVYYEVNDQTDYLVPLADGSVTRVGEVVTINGTQWLIRSGEKFKIPASVYEFLQQCPEQRRRVRGIPANKSIDLGMSFDRQPGQSPVSVKWGNFF